MRKVAMLLIVLFVIAGCNEEQMTTWIGTSQKTDINTGFGILDDKGTTEIGIEVEYDRSGDIDPSYRPDRIGPYILVWLTQQVTIEDTPEPSPFKDFLESLNARPYAGLNLLGVPEDGWRDIQPNFRAGTFFTVEPKSDLGIYTEYRDGDSVAPGLAIGLHGRF